MKVAKEELVKDIERARKRLEVYTGNIEID